MWTLVDVTISAIDEPNVLARARLGDPDAFGQLFDLHHDRIFGHALRQTSSVRDAEDITAVVFLEAWRRREVMRVVNGTVVGWLLVTTNRVFRDFVRSGRRYRTALAHLSNAEHVPDDAPVVDDRIDGDVQRAELRAVLSGLPKRDQDVISLRVVEELSTARAAGVLGIAPGTVKSLALAGARACLTAQFGSTQPFDYADGEPR